MLKQIQSYLWNILPNEVYPKFLVFSGNGHWPVMVPISIKENIKLSFNVSFVRETSRSSDGGNFSEKSLEQHQRCILSQQRFEESRNLNCLLKISLFRSLVTLLVPTNVNIWESLESDSFRYRVKSAIQTQENNNSEK